jgi:hypothetical protein
MKKLPLLLIAILLRGPLSAQTGGPGQPEFMQFQQAGTSDLVNPASGTFSYQIHLFSIGGYPMNLTYQSGVLMEDVASMVGLGWNCNAGAIVRTLRDLPDDFSGDVIVKQYSVAPNKTYGGKLGADLEFAGIEKDITKGLLKGKEAGLGFSLNASWGLFYNTYKGWGMEKSIGGGLSGSLTKNGTGPSANFGLGGSVNSQNGAERYMSSGLGLKYQGKSESLNLAVGHTISVNSTEGQKWGINTSLSMVRKTEGARKGVDQNGNKKDYDSDSHSTALSGYSHNSYLNNSFQSNIDQPFINISGNYSGTFGWDGYYVDPSFSVTGYFSNQELATTVREFPAFGTMYEYESANMPANAMMDYNREKDLPYLFGESNTLPIPFRTPDVFNLSAQGLAMSFSAIRNDIGVVGDPAGVSMAVGENAGVEVGLGNAFKAGANIGTNVSTQNSGKLSQASFEAQDNQKLDGTGFYRQWHFKNLGEINKFDETNFDLMGGHGPVQFDIADVNSAKSTFTNGSLIPVHVLNTAQPKRQSNIEYLTAKEAHNSDFGKMLSYYEFENPDKQVQVKRFGDESMPYRKGHHLSKIMVTQPDGMRYEFGFPVYNITQQEVSFNATEMELDTVKNWVRYVPNGPAADDSVINKRGIDHFFESTTMPAYATQFLITAVLGSDYRDLTGDGISEDDPGNYVKFEYYKEHNNYHWRTPYGEHNATYNAGLHSDPVDDRGSYVYGVKEVCYPKLMESKTEIAEFHYSDNGLNKRLDGYGVKGPDGEFSLNSFLRKLDSIVVYSLPDRKLNGDAATPIKTVRFGYSYSLCHGNENSSAATRGKLTLDSLVITHAHSKKGFHSPYKFEYGKLPSGGVMNPDYDSRDVNCWGYFQANPADGYSDCDNSKVLSNIDYPYALQDKSIMDKNAHAWNLTGITIPGGGKLSVKYESHDYAYVQNRSAGQMFKVAGISSEDKMVPGDNQLYLHSDQDPFPTLTMAIAKPFNRIYFKLQSPMTGDPATNKAELRQRYIHDLQGKYLYYKFLVKLNATEHEYVSGYAMVKDFGITPDGMYGYIDTEDTQLDDDNAGNGRCSAMLRSAFQFMRINCNKLVFENFMGGKAVNTLLDFIEELKSAREQMQNQANAFKIGINMYCKTKKFCREITLDKSFIRLFSPDQFKLAGGSRVSDISIDDNWDEMVGNTYAGKSYTTHYDYTTEATDLVHGKKIKISSGVADYEPLVGGDQNSLKQPIFYADEKKKAPDTEYYVEEPYNESLFPAPQITYSKVTETSNPTTLTGVGKTGVIVHEFYTAHDFPVLVSSTGIDSERDKTGYDKFHPPGLLTFQQQHDFAMVSQGFSIELNNMSGMPKATWVYNENGDRISGEVSEYFKSNHDIVTIDHTGTIHPKTTMGLSVMYTVEGRRSFDETVSNTFNANLNVSLPAAIPIPIIVPLFSQATEQKQFQSLVTNKIIQCNAILKSKTIYSQSASITTENLAFDEVTGEVLLTKTTNEFNDTLFSFKYPAWWKYAGMGPAYANSKLLVNAGNFSDSKKFLKAGDELRAIDDDVRIWVKDPQALANKAFISDDNGSATLGNANFIVYNPAAKNLLSSPMGQVVTWKWNPILHGNKIDFSGDTVVLNSSAVEYYDDAVLYCDTCSVLGNRFGKNDYLSGKKGNFKPRRTWFHLADRSYTDAAGGKTDLQKDGLFVSYNDFWLPPAIPGDTWAIDRSNWEWKERVNLTDVDGQTIETEDRIGRLSTNLLGYCNNLVIAQAVNAGYGETYFDGFEDYYYSFCQEPANWEAQHDDDLAETSMKRVKMESGTLVLVTHESHTGKYALKVSSALSFTIDPPTPCSEFAATFSGTGWTTNTGVASTSNTGYTLGSGAIAAPGAVISTPVTTTPAISAPAPGMPAISTPAPGTPAASTPSLGTSTTIVPLSIVQIPASFGPPSCIKCIGGFNPLKGKDYIFSAWVKVNSPPPVVNCADAKVTIMAVGKTPLTLFPQGPVIEGWQRMEGKFSMGPSSNEVTVTLLPGDYATFYDDLRIFPADGNMASYVYDDVKLKLTYTLDENNYFTKYEYNNQGELIRIKRETEEGIVTEKEGNSGLAKR